MRITMSEITENLNQLALGHPIGKLQDIRKDIKQLHRRSGSKIFSKRSTFENYAFHSGGRKELQFNIGIEEDPKDLFRHGVAFSLERSRTLPSIDALVPKIKFFNDYIELNADIFSDMKMWHNYPERSQDFPAGRIPSSIVKDGVFIFFGKTQPLEKIDYELVLTDFDRLLSLYEYVESAGATQPLLTPEDDFIFKPRHTQKVASTTASLKERELDIHLRHTILQESLFKQLVSKYGKDAVSTEQPTGMGTQIDVAVKRGDEYWFYEIKTALTARACIRQALGQLLEYGFWPGGQEPTRLVVVGQNPLDKDGREYILRLKEQFSLPIEYEAIAL